MKNYKQILNERLFNPNNPIGKIETGIQKLGAMINPYGHARKESEVAATRAAANRTQQTRNNMAQSSGGIVPSRADLESRIRQDNKNKRLDAIIAGPRSPEFQKMLDRYDPRPFGGRGLKEESNLLNEIGDTPRGQKALRSYIGSRVKGIEGIERENKRIDSSIRQVTNRLRGETTHTDEERQRGMQLVNMERKNKRKIERYKTGIDRALGSIKESNLLNEIGDTTRGKRALVRYLSTRMNDMKNLDQEAKRMIQVGNAHISNLERGNTPPERVVNAYSNMTRSLFHRKNKYQTGMRRAAANLMSTIQESNRLEEERLTKAQQSKMRRDWIARENRKAKGKETNAAKLNRIARENMAKRKPLNELSDDLLKRYIASAQKSKKAAKMRGREIQMSIGRNAPFGSPLRDPNSNAYWKAEQPAMKEFELARKRQRGQKLAFRLLGLDI